MNTASQSEFESINAGFCFWRRFEHGRTLQKVSATSSYVGNCQNPLTEGRVVYAIPVFAIIARGICIRTVGCLSSKRLARKDDHHHTEIVPKRERKRLMRAT